MDNTNIFIMLAQTANDPTYQDPSASGYQTIPSLTVDQIWAHLSSLNWTHSIGALTIASIFLLYGWRLFRLLVTLNFVFLGMLAGRVAGSHLGNAMWGGMLCSVAAAILPIPIMKYCVSFLGGCAGAAIGVLVHRGLANSSEFLLLGSGAIAGFVAGALLAFSSFKNTVTMFTSLQGTMALLVGCLSLAITQTPFAPQIRQRIFDTPMVLPILVCLITIGGMYIQSKFLAEAGKWKMPADEGWKRN